MKQRALVRTRRTPRLAGHNSMTFPRNLRDAIPAEPGYSGRVLELAAVDGRVLDTVIGPPVVHLNLHVRETGKLKGAFMLWMDLQPSAARALAATLNQVADRADTNSSSD